MPFHSKRRWSIAAVGSAIELAEKLTSHTWTLCTGFRFAGLLFLNDSTSEDGAQEYAIIDDNEAEYEGSQAAWQVESITFGWCDLAKALSIIEGLVARRSLVDMGPLLLDRCEPADEHEPCELCR